MLANHLEYVGIATSVSVAATSVSVAAFGIAEKACAGGEASEKLSVF